MTIEPIKPKLPFHFDEAISQPFRSWEGKAFVWRLLLWMTLGMGIVYLLCMPFILPHYGIIMEQSWLDTQALLNGTEPPDSSIIMDVYAQTAPAWIALILGGWIVLASAETALHRKILLRDEAQRTPLSFGKQELRVMLVQLGVWAMVMGTTMFAVFMSTLVATMFIVASPVIGTILMLLGFLAVFCLMIWMAIRLAPAAALTTGRNKRHLLAANRVTKYRFWNLFLAYFVVGFLGYLLVYVIFAICLVIATGDPQFIKGFVGFGDENPRVAFDAARIRLGSPMNMLVAIIVMFVYLAILNLWMLCLAGIGTYAVRWWQMDDPTPNFD